MLYFKLHFLTATALYLKVPLCLVEVLLLQVDILKLGCHLFFSVHEALVRTKTSAETGQGNADDIHTKLFSDIRVLGTVHQSYSHLMHITVL